MAVGCWCSCVATGWLADEFRLQVFQDDVRDLEELLLPGLEAGSPPTRPP